MTEIVFIYGLADPESTLVRYVGKSRDPRKRLLVHISDAKCGDKFALHNWIRQLIEKGLAPSLIILEESSQSDWNDAEQKWIKYYRNKNGKKFMLNMTDGGDCGPLLLAENRPNTTLTNDTVIRIREDRALGLTYAILCQKYSLPKHTIQRICTGRYWASVGGPIQKPVSKFSRRFTAEEIETIRNLYATGQYNQKQLAKAYNTSQSRIHEICTGSQHKDAGGTISGLNQRKWRVGAGNPATHLSDDMVLEIRRAYAAKELVQTQLAEKYGISQNAISQIVRRKKWAHI